MATRRVLLIDDEDDIRAVATVSLDKLGGWEVVAAGSGMEGLAKAETTRPDAILLDVMMPDIDGPATVKKLQANPVTKDIPIILLTAKIQAADRRRFQELGIAGLIAKPFDPLDLPHQVADYLGWEADAVTPVSDR
ncbi:MAG: response regulator [Actinomycetota bacterium]|nr:response regulator [Actinomycetota bacterium]